MRRRLAVLSHLEMRTGAVEQGSPRCDCARLAGVTRTHTRARTHARTHTHTHTHTRARARTHTQRIERPISQDIPVRAVWSHIKKERSRWIFLGYAPQPSISVPSQEVGLVLPAPVDAVVVRSIERWRPEKEPSWIVLAGWVLVTRGHRARVHEIRMHASRRADRIVVCRAC